MSGRSGVARGAASGFEGMPTRVLVFVPGLGLVPPPSRKERNRDAKSVSGVERVLGMERIGLYGFQLQSRGIVAAYILIRI
jgi:hypothetical protein